MNVFYSFRCLNKFTFFGSYPLSGRWGYSGLLFHKSLNNILYDFLIRHCTSKNQNFITITLFSISTFNGSKSWIVILIFVFFFNNC